MIGVEHVEVTSSCQEPKLRNGTPWSGVAIPRSREPRLFRLVRLPRLRNWNSERVTAGLILRPDRIVIRERIIA